MPRRAAVLVGVLLATLLAGPAFAQAIDASLDGTPAPVPPAVIARDANGQATVRTMRMPSPLTLDGKLEEAFYSDVESFGDFIQQEPIEHGPATDRTEVWVFFDDANIYVSARLWEADSSRRVANEMRRDSFNIYNNDHFAVLFDTFYDRRSGYQFNSNALGGLADAQVVNEQPNPNWNGLWMARTADFDGGWTVEMQIPFRSLRFREGAHTWGVMGSGLDERVTTDMGTPWGESPTCTSCGKCVQVCPTGALFEKGRSIAEGSKERRPFLPYLRVLDLDEDRP